MNIYKKIIALIILPSFFILNKSVAQDKGVVLKGEYNGKEVKLMWFFSRWKNFYLGVDIKRRLLDGSWELLTPNGITPATDIRNYDEVAKISTVSERIKTKHNDIITKGQLKAISSSEYRSRLIRDTSSVIALSLHFSNDYDMALIHGFGYCENLPVSNGSYEYGLFLRADGAENGRQLQTWKCVSGSSSLKNISISLKAYPNPDKDKINVSFSCSNHDLESSGYAGFIVEKKLETDLTSTPIHEGVIWKNTKKPVNHFLIDKKIEIGKVYLYTVKPVSIFGTMGLETTFLYNPEDFMGYASPPVLADSSIRSYTEGINISWTFDLKSNKFIHGFYIERKAHIDSSFVRVSSIIAPEVRNYLDKNRLKYENYYFYRIVAIPREPEIKNLYSIEMLTYYRPSVEMPVVSGVKAEYVNYGEHRYLNIYWDSVNIPYHKGYRIYVSYPDKSELLWISDAGDIKDTKFQYRVYNYFGTAYKIGITAVSQFEDESKMSDTIFVSCPSIIIPNIQLWPYKVDSNVITLEWKYKSLPDLLGFRIYNNGILLVDEKILSDKIRKWEYKANYNDSYNFQIEAVIQTGSVSRKSSPLIVKTWKKKDN